MPSPNAKRRLAAILVADVVAYSRLMGEDEAGTLVELKRLFSELVRPKLAEHGGRIVKTTGDGLLAEFASAVAAVQCAIELQAAIAIRNQDRANTKRVELRIGINVGDVLVEGLDLFGGGINVAARLEALCAPGGVALSASAYDQIRGRVAPNFEDAGTHSLKNIAEPVRVYRVGANTPEPRTPSLPEKPAIAVLPFTNMSGDPEQRYFADGITEDIITELSRARSLLVIARNSSFSYRDKAVDVRRIAHELSVHYVVEGSVRRMADRVRITAQLIDAISGNHLWSERFDRNIDDLFAIQDEVTQTIVTTITGRLEDAEIGKASRKRTDNLSAYDFLLRGVEQLRAYGPDVNRRARELFEQAVALDPRYALAHAYLALSLIIENGYAKASDSIKERALQAALRAVGLDPRESRCHIFLGQVYRFRDEYDLAISHLERGLALNPNEATGMIHLAVVLAVSGRAEEGIGILHRAIKLDPYLHLYWGTLARREPNFSVRAEMPPYKHAADAENLRQGLLMAGLPE